jgi:hypothetical protein
LIVCTKCGSQNPDGTKFCESCQTPMPQISPVLVDNPKVMERYMQLKEAADAVKSGDWTFEEFSEFLEEVTRVLVQKEQEIREIEIPEEAYDDFASELEVGFNGIALYNEGIANMMMYLEDKNSEHLDHGLEMAYQGNEQVNEAMRINRANKRKLEEMYMDTNQMA